MLNSRKIEPMDYWEKLRETVQQCMDKGGLPLTQVARKSGVGYKALQAFMSGQNSTMRPQAVESLSAFAQALGVSSANVGQAHKLPLQLSGFPLLVPVVDIRLFPEQGKGSDLVAKIERIKIFSKPSSVADELAFGVRMNEPIGEIQTGDVLIVSPQTKPMPGRAVGVRVDGELHIGQLDERDGEVGVSLGPEDGDGFIAESEYELMGSVVDHWRSMLDRSIF